MLSTKILYVLVGFLTVVSIKSQQYQGQQNVQYQQQTAPGQVQYQQVQQNQGQVQYQQQVGQHHQQLQQNENIIHDKRRIQDREHIKEHLEGVVDEKQVDPSKMSEEELQFHYFKMHDSDGNNQLDGTELCKSIIHWHVEESLHNKNSAPVRVFSDEELMNMIDPILKDDDRNSDGFIDYAEFAFAQQARSQVQN